MPYESKKQAAKFHAMLKRGEIDAATVNEYDKSTDFSHLPDRVKSNPVRAARKPRRKG